MRSKIVALLALLLAAPSHAAIFPTQATLTVGGTTFTDPSRIIMLVCQAHQITNLRGTCRKLGGTAGYTVTTGKVFYVLAARSNTVMGGTALYGGLTAIAQTDNDLGTGSSSAFTNPVYLGGAVFSAAFVGAIGPNAFTEIAFGNLTTSTSYLFGVAAAKYISIQVDGSAGFNTNAFIYGYEATP